MTAASSSYMGFVGVTTRSSAIMQIFPTWADVLGLPTRTLLGYDLKIQAPPEAYREVIWEIKSDPRHWGALVTTHKMAVYASAADLFDEVDELARTFGEISCVAKRSNRLTGGAKDPVTAQLALEEFLPADHFGSTGAAALILGSGGSGCALSHSLGKRADRPTFITCTALSHGPLEHQRQLHDRAGIDADLMRYVITSRPEEVDALLAGLPPASLVVNATGMGKDLPGSPLTDAGRFPEHGVIWEFNYRGSLEFLAQARRQQFERRLHVEDGWRYFIHGWTQVIAEIFDIPMSRDTVDELSRVAAGLRQ